MGCVASERPSANPSGLLYPDKQPRVFPWHVSPLSSCVTWCHCYVSLSAVFTAWLLLKDSVSGMWEQKCPLGPLHRFLISKASCIQRWCWWFIIVHDVDLCYAAVGYGSCLKCVTVKLHLLLWFKKPWGCVTVYYYTVCIRTSWSQCNKMGI